MKVGRRYQVFFGLGYYNRGVEGNRACLTGNVESEVSETYMNL